MKRPSLAAAAAIAVTAVSLGISAPAAVAAAPASHPGHGHVSVHGHGPATHKARRLVMEQRKITREIHRKDTALARILRFKGHARLGAAHAAAVSTIVAADRSSLQNLLHPVAATTTIDETRTLAKQVHAVRPPVYYAVINDLRRAARIQSQVTTNDSSVSDLVIGMSAPANQWTARLEETGPVQSRRLFSQLSSPDGAIRTATSEVAAGRMPIVSFKVANNDWAGVAAGKYDTQLKSVTTRLAAIGGRVFVTLHHEPQGDGTPANYSAMMRHALPILGAPTSVYAGPIVNGFWWSSGNQGLTDAGIAQWLPADLLAKSEIVAADTYQAGTTEKPGEDAGVKIANMSKWATRVGVKKLGIGEYNGLNAASITAAGSAILADPRFTFASVFNSNVNNRAGISWQLTGDRLGAFKGTLAQSQASAN